MRMSRVIWVVVAVVALGTAMFVYSYAQGKANHSVTLSWTASPGATSYHVYRGTSSGGPYTQVGTAQINAYLDKSVTSGTTYYYVVTTVRESRESAYSKEIKAAIP